MLIGHSPQLDSEEVEKEEVDEEYEEHGNAMKDQTILKVMKLQFH